MTHSIKVKREVEEDIEVKIPSFWTDDITHYGIIDVDNVYEVLVLDKFCAIHNGTLESMKMPIRSAIKHKEITEEEFFAAYEKARNLQELKPQLSYYAGANGIEKQINHY